MADIETLSNPSLSISSLCEECCSNPWKYRCPGCSIKSCSLPCVKSHKARTNCTGKRNRAEFVPLSQFDDSLLISDYALLEETKRVAESARRMARDIGGFRGYIGFKLPKSLLMLRNAANRRKTKLLLLPPGMSKRRANQSRYDRRKNSIFWTIEWRFNAMDVVLLDHGVDEHASLSSLIEKHLAPTPLKNPLTPYRNVRIDDLKFFLRKNPKGLKSPFRELDIKAPIGRQLADVVILEYPVIIVFLPSHSYDFEVERNMRSPSRKEGCPGSSDGNLSPKGNLFLEEEIEEGEMFSDTLVTDLTHHVNSVTGASVGSQQDWPLGEKTGRVSDMDMSKKSFNCPKSNSSQKHQSSIFNEAKRNRHSACILQDQDTKLSGTVAGGTAPFASRRPEASLMEKTEMYPGSSVNSWEPAAEVNFDFERELRDAYQDLMGEINPDDYLCFDVAGNLEEFLGEEDLEEGEIPNH